MLLTEMDGVVWFVILFQVPLPNQEPSWYTLINNTTLESILAISKELLKLYKRAKPDGDKLEAAVSLLKKAQQDAKAKLKSQRGGGNTPQATVGSRPATPSKISPYDNRKPADKLLNGWVRCSVQSRFVLCLLFILAVELLAMRISSGSNHCSSIVCFTVAASRS